MSEVLDYNGRVASDIVQTMADYVQLIAGEQRQALPCRGWNDVDMDEDCTCLFCRHATSDQFQNLIKTKAEDYINGHSYAHTAGVKKSILDSLLAFHQFVGEVIQSLENIKK